METIINPIAVPFGMLLMWLYELVNNYALALILIAILIRVILLPFQMKGTRGRLRQTRLQPKVAEIQKRHAANKQKLNEEMAKFYKEEGVNPASGCLWTMIPMPIMIAIFYAIRQPLTLMMRIPAYMLEEGGAIYQRLVETGYEFTEGFYEQVAQTHFMTNNWEYFSEFANDGLRQMSFYLTGDFLNLGEIPQWAVWDFEWGTPALLIPSLILFVIPILSGGVNFISAGIMRKMNPQQQAMAGSMGTVMKMMPLMSVFFGFIVPAALSIYWAVGSALQIGQDLWLTKKYTKILDVEDAERDKIRKAKEAELEAKRLETERKKAEGIIEENKNKSKRKKKKGNKQEKREKAAKWEQENAPSKKASKDKKKEAGRVGDRPFARGRAYDPDRYKKKGKKKSIQLTDGDEELDTDDAIEEDVAVLADAEYVSAEAEYVDDASEDDAEDGAVDDSDDIEDYESFDADYDDANDSDDGNEDEDYEDGDDVDDGDDEADIDYEDGEDDADDSDDGDDSSSSQTTRFDTKRF